MKLDVVTRLEPYHKIGFIHVPNVNYATGAEIVVPVIEELELCAPYEKVSDTFVRKTEIIKVQVIRKNGVSWLAVTTDESVEWWERIQGFVRLEEGLI